MTYSIFLGHQANKFFFTADKRLKARLEQLFAILQNDPLPSATYDIIKIKGIEKGYRIRLGDYRVVFQLFSQQKEVFILKIDKRAAVYKDLKKE